MIHLAIVVTDKTPQAILHTDKNNLMLITKAEESSRPLRSLTEQSRMGSHRTAGVTLTHFTNNSMVSLFCKSEFYFMLLAVAQVYVLKGGILQVHSYIGCMTG